LSSKKQTSVVCLILSIDKSPWREMQEYGQNETFVGKNSKSISYLRYSGHHAEPSPLLRITLIFKTFQHRVFLAFSNNRFMGWLSGISLWRLGDDMLRKSQTWGLPETYLQSNSKLGKLSSPDTIVTQSIELSTLIGLKTLQAFQFLLDNYEFEFVFRTNSSSYVDGDLLLEITKELGDGDFYGGVVGKSRTGLFASGAGILMSKSLVEKVLSRASLWRHGLIDDVALGRLVDEAILPQIEIAPLPRIQYESLEEVRQAGDEEIKFGYHFRCKTDSSEETIQIMKEIWLRKANK